MLLDPARSEKLEPVFMKVCSGEVILLTITDLVSTSFFIPHDAGEPIDRKT
jgi:hypothetical protein